MNGVAAVEAQKKCKCGWLLPNYELEVRAPFAMPAEIKLDFTLTMICPKCQRRIGIAGHN